MIRALCLVGGLTGAAGLSQFPEFSQQYMQRLGGQVDELTRVVVGFDDTALAEGLGREEILQEMSTTPLMEGQVAMWRGTFARHARLSENLMVLQAASPLERVMMPQRMMDTATARATWADFTPAMPLSAAGAAATGTGFLGGWLAFAGVLSVLLWPFRKATPTRKPAPKRRAPAVKNDPPVMRPQLVSTTPDNRPRLAGVQR
ncbi:DUF2937 family protein [Loktanella sp. Alg231-35]|uniref:DUF2937 family protein n=1 Tax=Loktanella sp. Alg231-35 TaxID=1922220 RepID=UPI000D560817|nr:DUF2937 family protein [Loktanella sp. Alg231-35]